MAVILYVLQSVSKYNRKPETGIKLVVCRCMLCICDMFEIVIVGLFLANLFTSSSKKNLNPTIGDSGLTISICL